MQSELDIVWKEDKKDTEKVFNDNTKSVFDEHQSFLERKKQFVEERNKRRRAVNR